MTRMGDTTEIMGKNRLIGQLQANEEAADEARLRAESARRQAESAQWTAESDARRAKDAAKKAKKELDEAVAENQKLTEAVAAKEALIIEWMHSNESFKRLAQKYGKRLSISEEQQQAEYRHEVLDSSEENPKFAETGLIGRVKAKLGAGSTKA